MYFENEDIIDKYFMDIVSDPTVKCIDNVQSLNQIIKNFDRNYVDASKTYHELISRISLNNITIKTTFNIVYIVCEYKKFEKFYKKIHKYSSDIQFASKLQEKVFELSLYELFTVTKKYQKHDKTKADKYPNFDPDYDFFDDYTETFIQKYDSNFIDIESIVDEYVSNKIKQTQSQAQPTTQNTVQSQVQSQVKTNTIDTKRELAAILSKK